MISVRACTIRKNTFEHTHTYAASVHDLASSPGSPPREHILIVAYFVGERATRNNCSRAVESLGTRLCMNCDAARFSAADIPVPPSLTLYTLLHYIAQYVRYGDAHAFPYVACNVATTRRLE